MVRFGLLQLFESPAGRTEKEYFDDNIALIRYADEVGWTASGWRSTTSATTASCRRPRSWPAYAAAVTRRIRIGTGVVVLPFHNPVRVAEEFAFIDQLSGGRLDFGVGRGYQPAEFRGYGIPMEESRGRFAESLAIIQQAWTRESFDFDGEFFKLQGVRTRPRPFQKPHPPLFGASFNPDTIRYQAMQELNLLFTPALAPPSSVAGYRQILQDRGRNPDDFRIGGLVFVYLDEDRERAFHDFEDPCMWYYRTFTRMIPAREYPEAEGYYRNLHETLSGFVAAYDAGQITFAQAVQHGPFEHAFLVGDPPMVRKKLLRLLEMYGGLTDVLCWTRLGGLAHDKVMRSMDLLANEVVKPLRESQELPASIATELSPPRRHKAHGDGDGQAQDPAGSRRAAPAGTNQPRTERGSGGRWRVHDVRHLGSPRIGGGALARRRRAAARPSGGDPPGQRTRPGLRHRLLQRPQGRGCGSAGEHPAGGAGDRGHREPLPGFGSSSSAAP